MLSRRDCRSGLWLVLWGLVGCSSSGKPNDEDLHQSAPPPVQRDGIAGSAAENELPGPSEPPAKPEMAVEQESDDVALAVAFDGEGYSRIWGASDDDIWILGGAVAPAVPTDPNAQPMAVPAILPCNVGQSAVLSRHYLRHFDGRSWTRTEVDAGGLRALHGSDSENVWAVGSNTILRLEGTSWVQQDIANAIEHDPSDDCYEEATLWSVFARAADDVWAVGYIFPSSLGPGLILHFDGERWSRMPVDAGDGFFAVWAAAADDAWAMGSSGIAYHYDGERWSVAQVGTQQYLWSIWGSAGDDVWASGNVGTQLHFDGREWASVPSPDAHELHSLTGRAADDVWNVTQPSVTGGQALLHFDGARWQSAPVSGDELIADLWVSPSGKLWSVGSRIARRN